ncbi:MAG: YvcK family protein [Acidobacteria bacterium]|nr:YvcK family protein [Acidobacteriota bacterium]
MRLRQVNVGCFGGGTGLPSLLGGLKNNPWLHLNAVVTMFDSGGSSGQLRDELGVLPPGDILKCALALSRKPREARRVLLARLPTLEHARLGGHTGGNLLRRRAAKLRWTPGRRRAGSCRKSGSRPRCRSIRPLPRRSPSSTPRSSVPAASIRA